MGCDIVTISTDSHFVHLAWRKAEKSLADVRFAMASDTTGNAARLFSVYDETSGMAIRGTFLVNPDGRLLSSEIHWYNVGRNIDELLRKFKANMHVARKTNEVCPSKWNDEGDKTLVNPGAKMVGKVHEALVGV